MSYINIQRNSYDTLLLHRFTTFRCHCHSPAYIATYIKARFASNSL